LQAEIDRLFDQESCVYTDEDFLLFERFKARAQRRRVRAAEPCSETRTGWRVNAWVKKGILLGFRMGAVIDMSVDSERQPFLTNPPFRSSASPSRAVCASCPALQHPRRPAIIGEGVVLHAAHVYQRWPWVDDGTMVDSHALVGSCAQVGKNCQHLGRRQIGGVLEPVGAMPVIVEDDVLVGGNCGIYEGTVVKAARGARHRNHPQSFDPGLRPGPQQPSTAPR